MSLPPTPEEDRAVRAAVGRHLQAEVVEIDKLVGRVGRRVFFVRLEDREVVLKVLDSRKSRAVGCEFAVDSLRQVGVPTPRVLAVDRSGWRESGPFDYPFLILERVAGLPMDRWVLEEKPQPRPLSTVLRRVGENLRKIHSVRVPSGWGLLNDQGVGRFGSWLEYLEKHRVRRADGSKVLALDTEWLEREDLLTPVWRARLDWLLERRDSFAALAEARLVHNDLTLKNIFLDPADLRVTAILDLHNALAGDPALDLARFEYFYRGRGYRAALRAGYGEMESPFESRRLHLLVFVLLEKISWLRGREERFPGRLEDDLALLRQTVARLS